MPVEDASRLSAILIFVLLCILSLPAQISKFDRNHAQSMLREVSDDVEKHYYDPKLRGVDWTAKLHQAAQNINTTDSMDGALAEIAALLDSLDDSHTFLIPPARNYIHDYGFTMQMVGNRCYVTHLTAGSDAEKKGVKVGDEVVAINGAHLSRKIFWKILYLYKNLRPQPGLQVTIGDSAGHPQQLDVAAKIVPSEVVHYRLHNGINHMVSEYERASLLLHPRYVEKNDDLIIIQIPAFDLSAVEVDDVIGKMRKHKAAILDLRDNPGGFTESLERLTGGLFQNDVKVFDRVTRTKNDAVIASGRHGDAFLGRFAVLIDSESASASELFARVIQLEKRGFVIGDRSSGSVMEASHYRHAFYFDSETYYGVSITDANLVMTDGNSLEHVGVDPDIVILPTPADLAENRDPALSKAAALMGVKINPEEAGKLFPYLGPLEH
jgi:carboxyl-terminal processing protease